MVLARNLMVKEVTSYMKPEILSKIRKNKIEQEVRGFPSVRGDDL